VIFINELVKMAKRQKNKKEVKETGMPEESENKKQSKQQESQLKWIILGMIALILLIIAIYFVIQGSKYFNYGGLTYEKVTSRNVDLYHTQMALKDVDGNLVANYNLYLRNDPRELKNITIDGNFVLKNRNVIVSLDPEVERGCEDSGIAGANFFSFMKVSGYDVKIGYTNKTYAQERNASFSNCDVNYGPYYDFVVIKRGNETSIVKREENCYELYFKDCEILKVTERFMVALYANSKGVEI